MTKVALAKGKSRLEAVGAALALIDDEIALKITGKSRIVIKPNFVVVFRQLAATHRHAVEAIIRNLQRHTDSQIVIAEGASAGPTSLGYRIYRYNSFAQKYGVKLTDLNAEDGIAMEAGPPRHPLTLKVAPSIAASDFLVSAAVMKTHCDVGATLSIKNLVGALPTLKGKQQVHSGGFNIHHHVFRLAQEFMPALAVVDGFVAMEGAGPSGGTAVRMGVALAGIDPVAVDTVAAYLMGFAIEEIAYLNLCHLHGLGEGDISKIQVLGEKPELIRRNFRRPKYWQPAPSPPHFHPDAYG